MLSYEVLITSPFFLPFFASKACLWPMHVLLLQKKQLANQMGVLISSVTERGVGNKLPSYEQAIQFSQRLNTKVLSGGSRIQPPLTSSFCHLDVHFPVIYSSLSPFQNHFLVPWSTGPRNMNLVICPQEMAHLLLQASNGGHRFCMNQTRSQSFL